MKKKYPNKAITNADFDSKRFPKNRTKGSPSSKDEVLNTYYFPTLQRNIKAKSMEEAMAIVKSAN